MKEKQMMAHILLVEDEVKLARFIELELGSEGYRVSVAHDGHEWTIFGTGVGARFSDFGLDVARFNWCRTLSPNAIDWD